MATKTSRPPTRRTTLYTGPWTGVKDTRDPWDDNQSQLVDLRNCYIPDPQGGSGAYARRGFGILNLQGPYTGKGQAVYSHVVNEEVYDFIVAGGKLYRANNGHTIFTDVTPVSGAAISATSPRVYLTTFGEQLIISDGVNQPWIASDLNATPITGTVIDYNGTGVPGSGDVWSAFGQPVVYAGSLFFILNEVAGTKQRTTLTWSAPGNPAQGYQQDDGATNSFDYSWTLEQTSAHPIYALAATNVALFYFRDGSIGALAGTPGPGFQGSSTHDIVSVNVGCLQSATVQQYGQTIFFCDDLGRPYALQPGSPPVPIWLNMRQVVSDSTSEYPSATAKVACATIHPNLDLYIAAIYSPDPGEPNPPIQAVAFDVKTLAYVGRWSIRNGATWEALGILNNAGGYAELVVLGNEPPYDGGGFLITTESGITITTESGIEWGTVPTNASRDGVIWGMDAQIGDGDPITSEDGLFIITSEDGVEITSENQVISWADDGLPPERSLTTQRLGYASDVVWNADSVTVIAESPAPCAISVMTPTTVSTLEGTPQPFASFDGTYRLVGGLNTQGRGHQVTVTPTTADEQWIVQSVGMVLIPSTAGWNER